MLSRSTTGFQGLMTCRTGLRDEEAHFRADQPPQRRQPGRHVLGALVVPATAHREPSFVVACSTLSRGVQGRVRLSRTEYHPRSAACERLFAAGLPSDWGSSLRG